MNTRLLLLALVVLPLHGHAEALDLKTGAWQIEMSTTVAGMPIPEASLAQMPAAQRAKVEESMRARAGEVDKQTYRTCLTKEDVDRGDLFESEDENCKRKVIEQTSRRFDIEETCGAPEPSTTHMTFATESPESYTATMDRTEGEGGRVHVEMNGSWVAAACSEDDED